MADAINFLRRGEWSEERRGNSASRRKYQSAIRIRNDGTPMMTRSRIHLLLAASARIEETGGDPKIAKAFKDAAQWEATLRAESRDGSWKRDEKRIDRQRTLFAMIPDSRALTIFRDAVLQRAYDLLCDGDGSACDALLEFMPSAEAESLLNAWSADQDNDKPLSPWYAGKGAVA